MYTWWICLLLKQRTCESQATRLHHAVQTGEPNPEQSSHCWTVHWHWHPCWAVVPLCQRSRDQPPPSVLSPSSPSEHNPLQRREYEKLGDHTARHRGQVTTRISQSQPHHDNDNKSMKSVFVHSYSSKTVTSVLMKTCSPNSSVFTCKSSYCFSAF